MDNRDPDERDRPNPEEENRPPRQADFGGQYGRPAEPKRVYRDPYTGNPQGRQRNDPVPGEKGPGDEKAFSVLAYIGILWLVGLLADRENPTVRFHVNQGIILSIFEFALAFTLAIVKAMVHAVFVFALSGVPLFSWLGTTINGLLTFAGWCLVLSYVLIGAIRAAQGRQEPLPLIGTLFSVIR